jgi:acyl-CoA thioester hydrolase
MIFTHPIRVYWEDTDAGGIVYHSNYLNFAERARTEMVRGLGIDQRGLADGGKGFAFAVRRAEMDFRKPARLEDRLEVETRVTAAGGASLSLCQDIRRLDDGADLVRLHIELAFIDLAQGRPARLPETIRATLRALVSERR